MTVTVANETHLFSKDLGADGWLTRLSVPSMHCGGCMRNVEKSLLDTKSVIKARVNLTGKFVDVTWSGDQAPDLVAALSKVGHEGHLGELDQNSVDPHLQYLIRALAVAGFAAGNIMMFSIAVWSGADAVMQEIFHWVSAAIALPTLLYSGQVFFTSAWSALKNWQTNMDVPISIGITLAFMMSLYDTIYKSGHIYFDASVMLLFFLLVGRTLDQVMREKARNVVAGFSRLIPKGAIVVDGLTKTFTALEQIGLGDTLLVKSGDRIPLDGTITSGASQLDCSVVTGESLPRTIRVGNTVVAGMLNLGSEFQINVTAKSDQSFLAQTARSLETVTSSRSSYHRLADRASKLYAPVVHTAALLTFAYWFMTVGDWHLALTYAISVLIITCPCALALAVPIVQVVAASRLLEAGILVRDGEALERLTEVDTVVFDKTGTLTSSRPSLLKSNVERSKFLQVAASLADHSSHPYSAAISQSVDDRTHSAISFDDIKEISGLGIKAIYDGKEYRLGKTSWAVTEKNDPNLQAINNPEVSLSCNGKLLETYEIANEVDPSARGMVQYLQEAGYHLSILSGDGIEAVKSTAEFLGIGDYECGHLPKDKTSKIENITQADKRVLFVGDGLNDALAMATAHVSLAPTNAADISRNSADFVLLKNNLSAIKTIIGIATKAQILIKQNFGIAIIYNLLALPLAVLGYVTPLIAAVAMSISSLIVVLNAIRLRAQKDEVMEK